MTITNPKPGGWATNELLTSDQMDAIIGELIKAIDGVGGGSYSLGAPLILGGNTVRIDQELYINSAATENVDGELHLRTGSTLVVDDVFGFSGAGSFTNGVNFTDLVQFQSTGAVTFAAGNFVSFATLNDLHVQSITQAMRVPLVPLFNIENNAGFQEDWRFDSSAIGGWQNSTLGALMQFMLPLMAGDVLVSVTATVGNSSGGPHGADPAQKRRLRVLEAPSASGAYTAIATQVDSTTGAGYDATHALTASASNYTALDRHYIIEFRAEAGANSIANSDTLYQLQATVVRKRLVSGNTFGS